MTIMEKLQCGKYFISESNGKFEILKHNAWSVSNAMMLNDGVFIWDYAPVFDSKFKAYAWLKNHVSELL